MAFILFSRELNVANPYLRKCFRELMQSFQGDLITKLEAMRSAGKTRVDLTHEEGAIFLSSLVQELAIRWGWICVALRWSIKDPAYSIVNYGFFRQEDDMSKLAALVAIAFGLLTIMSGGMALKNPAAMGAVVPFVLWFNFLAGFAYVVAGLLLWRRHRLAGVAAVAIFVATALVFAAFAIHVLAGGGYETRTVGAMMLRTVFWGILAVVSTRIARHTSAI